jgi:3-oxoacyl-[acyl-carrier protein] reductase
MFNLGLSGKVAIVTGAGSGVGEVASMILADEGANVVLADLVGERVERVARKIEDEGGNAFPFEVDISDHKRVQELFQTTHKKYGRVDILAAIAAIGDIGKIEEVTDEKLERVIAVNLKGTFYCVQEAVKIMKKQGAGKIVTVSSDTAKKGGSRPGGAGSHYAASKAGIIALMKTVAIELRGYEDININCICPGPLDTPAHYDMKEEHRREITKEILKGRFGKPEEVANVIVFLVSDLSKFIYGETINVDGGVVRE